MEIRFSPDAPLYRDANLTVVFAAFVDGERVPCAISVEALEDHFGARAADCDAWIRAFDSGRSRIEAVLLQFDHGLGECAHEGVASPLQGWREDRIEQCGCCTAHDGDQVERNGRSSCGGVARTVARRFVGDAHGSRRVAPSGGGANGGPG